MKKALLFLLLFVSVSENLRAQTFAEWFQQKKTQKEYLVQQIAALQTYIEFAEKGYRIAKEGLTTIANFTKGEFNLHTDFFNSLKNVNPEVKRYVKVAETISLQVQIVQNCNRAIRKFKNMDAFSNDELSYIGSVFNRLLDDCDKSLDELIIIITDGKLEMKDDERIERIDKLYVEVQDMSMFLKNFTGDAQSLAVSRLKEETDVQTIRAWHGIKDKQR
ncbi:MAG TPA: hypothetical protein VFI29_14800 [Hanamia sp.]|nr:hypothetical protein [Hanamia sp.]